MAHHDLDVQGLNCPLPILKAKKFMKSLDTGDTLEVLSTDSGDRISWRCVSFPIRCEFSHKETLAQRSPWQKLDD